MADSNKNKGIFSKIKEIFTGASDEPDSVEPKEEAPAPTPEAKPPNPSDEKIDSGEAPAPEKQPEPTPKAPANPAPKPEPEPAPIAKTKPTTAKKSEPISPEEPPKPAKSPPRMTPPSTPKSGPEPPKPLEPEKETAPSPEKGKNNITLMISEPGWMHAYWNLSGNQKDLILRVCKIEQNGDAVESHFDIDIPDGTGKWYVRVTAQDRDWKAKLGHKKANKFTEICESNVIRTPRTSTQVLEDTEPLMTDEHGEYIESESGNGAGKSAKAQAGGAALSNDLKRVYELSMGTEVITEQGGSSSELVESRRLRLSEMHSSESASR